MYFLHPLKCVQKTNPANCNARLAESIFQTHAKIIN
ncbi:DUF6783 domain-containing protein [Blautia wexlerae]